MKNLFKKILLVFGIISLVSVFTNFVAPEQSFAAESFTGSCRNFLGLTSWDCNVNISNENSLKSGIWNIVANVLTDITVIAAYLVLGYVIYGGYLYIFSSGESSKVAAAKKTLTHAFIGLGIVLLANVIMGSIRIALVGGTGDIGDCVKNSGCIAPGQMVSNLITWVIGVAGVVSAIFVVYGGISYITSSGDPGKVKKAKDIILYALIGLIICALAEIITAFVTSTINNAVSADPLLNETIISKEVNEINEIN